MRCGVRRRARAVSGLSASLTVSRTNSLMTSSPQAPSVPRPKPPAKPLTPAKPAPWTSHESPSSTVTRPAKLCRGPMLSRMQYPIDTEQWGYSDPRLPPWGRMTPEPITHWTAAGR
jgi:hypothetical protein